MDWVFEPDPDRSDIDRGLVHVLPFVVAGGHRAVLFELVVAPFHDVALLIALGVEHRWSPTPAAPVTTVLDLIGGLGDGRGDPPPPQIAADGLVGERLVTQHMPRRRAGTPTAMAQDLD